MARPPFNDDNYTSNSTLFSTWRTWLLGKLSAIADYVEEIMNTHEAVHAPSNAQAHIAPTKAEIEAVLIGEIASHTHAGGGAGDMLASAYDTTATGSKVDTAINAEKVNDLTVETAVPVGALFTDTDTNTQRTDQEITDLALAEVTKVNIETVLIGEISSHSHAGGTPNPNIFVPSAALDFTSPNPAHANKIWDIQADIDLGAGNCDLSAVANVVFSFSSGSLTTTGTITGNKTVIKGALQDTIYIPDSVILAGTWNCREISAHWFGMKNNTTSALYDNKPALKNALFVANTSKFCQVNIYKEDDIFYVGLSEYLSFEDDNVNLGVFNTTGVDIVGHGLPVIKSLDDEVNAHNQVFQFNKAPLCSISGLEIIGDKDSATNLPEHKMGITVGNDSHLVRIHNNKIHGFSGDGVYFMTKQYVGYTPDQGDADFDIGSISPTTGLLVPTDTEQMSSNAFLDISTSLFQDRGYLYVEGRTIKDNYKIAYYDASFTFIHQTRLVEFYDRIYFPSNARYVKLEIGYEAALDTGRPIAIQCFENPIGVKIYENEVYECMRQGISNASHFTEIYDNEIHDIYGQAAGPCYGIDLEDGTYYIAYVRISNNTFWNNSGGHVILKYNRHISIINNKFLDKGVPDVTHGYYGDFVSGLSSNLSIGTEVYGNVFQGRSVSLGRENNFHHNYLKNTNISMEKASCVASENTFLNCSINSVADTYIYEGLPIMRDNNFIWDRSYEYNIDESPFKDMGRYESVNNFFDFKGFSDDASRVMNYMGSAGSNVNSSTGSIDGMKIKNFKGTVFAGWTNQMQNVMNSEFSCPLQLKDLINAPRDFKFTNVKAKQYLTLDLRTFTDVLFPTAAEYPTLTFEGVDILKDETFTTGMLNVTGGDGCFNLVFKDCTFISTVTVLTLMVLANKGTVTFDNCKFQTISAEIFNFSGSNTSKATVRNCEFINVTFNKRATDVFENNIIGGVSKSEYPEYADSAAAIAGGLIAGERYITATGVLMIVV